MKSRTILSVVASAFVQEVLSAALGKAPKFATVVSPRDVADTEYDFIIAGGGISGLTVADRLTEDPSINVLVIETGGFDQNEDFVLVPGSFFPVPYMWLPLLSVPQPALNNKVFNIPAGKVVGGGSVVNGMVYVRPSKEELKAWELLGATGWDWNDLLPYYKKSETFTPPDPAFAAAANFSFDPSVHGTSGPVKASFPNFYFEGSRNWFQAAISSGLKAAGDPMAGDATGVIFIPSVVNGETRTRSHARISHYTPVQSRPNYHILDSHTVSKVLFNAQKKAIGVEYLPTAGGQTLTAHAKKEVLLAAGAIHTPQILQLSGVGPKKLLEKFSIPVVADLPGVGANFHDQPSIIIPYNVTNNIHPNVGTLNEDPAYDAAQRALYDTSKTGPYVLTRGLSSNLALPPLCKTTSKCHSILASAALTNPFKYLPEATHPTVKAGYALQRSMILGQLAGDKVPVSMIHWDTANSVRMYFFKPLSRGTVQIGSTDPRQTPLIDPRTNSDPVDEELILASFLKNREIMNQPTMAVLNPLEAAPFSNSVTDEAQLKRILAEVAEPSSAHQCCTAAMMPKLLGGVVDSKMRVYDVSGLRVIDTSFWPMVLTAAPTATTYASGEKIADAIKAAYGLL
ncbi:putative GMC oxidoreductase [Podospora australis]|uniref:GMC oxidoreductase n=1 Tax=Podospora australis TaxID=1536484 RepID=A0AAN6WIP5_9PEZI|nr:putative GMC oxidoreductase [Podospora australis]